MNPRRRCGMCVSESRIVLRGRDIDEGRRLNCLIGEHFGGRALLSMVFYILYTMAFQRTLQLLEGLRFCRW
jgi:hypothetical protein